MRDKFNSMMRYEKVNLLTKVATILFMTITITSIVTGLWIYLLALIGFLMVSGLAWAVIREVVNYIM